MMALSSWTTGNSIPGVMPYLPGCPMADVHFGLLKKCICVLECLSYVEVLSPAFWVWPYLEIRFADVKMSGWGPNGLERAPNAVTSVLMRDRREIWQHKHRGMKPRDDESREWSDMATSYGHWDWQSPPEARSSRKDPLPAPAERSLAVGTCGLPAPVSWENTCMSF